MKKAEKELIVQQVYNLLSDENKRDIPLSIFQKHMMEWLLIRDRYKKILESADFNEMYVSLMWQATVREAVGTISKIMDTKPKFQPPTDLAGKVRLAKWFARQFDSPQEAYEILGAALERI